MPAKKGQRSVRPARVVAQETPRRCDLAVPRCDASSRALSWQARRPPGKPHETRLLVALARWMLLLCVMRSTDPMRGEGHMQRIVIVFALIVAASACGSGGPDPTPVVDGG